MRERERNWRRAGAEEMRAREREMRERERVWERNWRRASERERCGRGCSVDSWAVKWAVFSFSLFHDP
jgi:hypothetical protein